MSAASASNKATSSPSWCCWLFCEDSDSDDDTRDVVSQKQNNQRMRNATHVNELGKRVRTFVEIRPGEFATHDYVREQGNHFKRLAPEADFQKAYAVAQRALQANHGATAQSAAAIPSAATWSPVDLVPPSQTAAPSEPISLSETISEHSSAKS